MSIAHPHDHHHHEHDDESDSDLAPDRSSRTPGMPVKWYRPKIPREMMSALNRKSDVLGFAQTVGFLLTLVGTGTLVVYSTFAWPGYVTLLAFYVHGTCCCFIINGFHELVHDSVFKTRWLNGFFLRIFSFFGWWNHIEFWASHTEHHKFTLHPPDDQEVILPVRYRWFNLMKVAIIDYESLWYTMKGNVRVALGKVDGEWTNHLFPEDKPELRRARANWARLLILGHGAIGVVSISTGWWPVFIVASFGRFYGGLLQFLCNAAQHTGLQDHVPDFRRCCRTIYLNPVLRFLYWHMNFHTEHHMYAGVPCYNLGKLHAFIRPDMPICPNGLIAMWVQINGILQRQKVEPTYQYEPEWPPTATNLADRAPIAPDRASPSTP
jgi:fatty acid desaturase